MVKIITAIDGNIPTKFAHSFNIMKMSQGFKDITGDVELVTLQTVKTIFNKLKIRSISEHYGVDSNLKIKFISVFSRDSLKKAIGVRGFHKKAAAYIKSQNPDLVFCRSYLIALESVKLGLNTVIETHATNYDTNIALNDIFKISNKPNFKGLVTISNILKEEYVKRGVPESKVLVLEDGVDLSQFNISNDKGYWRKKLNLPLNKKILLYSGGLYKEKGIESILKTHKLLSEKRDDVVSIFIGGEDQQVREWLDYCLEHNINNVLFLGFKPNSHLPRYMKAADILMMPYDTTVNYKVMDVNTTSPLKLFEYMGSNRPVVSSNIPVIKKIVKHNESAMLADENSVESQVDLVLKLLDNEILSEKIANNAYEVVKQYEWKERCKVIIEKNI